MIQFYFLSILLNALAGYALVLDQDDRTPVTGGLREYLLDETFRLVLGVLALSTGFFKLLSAVRGDIPVIGDLVPSAAGLASGFALVFEFYRSRSTILSDASERLELIFVKNRKWLGYGAMAAAVAHFLFPTVLFL
ncbi:MAG: hypothetical protein A2Z99_17175 [Treponema sp. GWB1_62_6]|nr:MAG: hypothetical protein A2Y36_05415 [Treponema sp. GWA1_62_8]OHE64599.1 MAG: hypothetical protein A2Z99_17175 [Treponema sp. GWB1_62_6]OHE69255.1 MAG: hypothetical protein A2001_13740 [Treponema sp. GWC1_61_84]OHE75267.1 MAG: hypothetical protein A2413_18475 [Treponema sp. RIFOXYC1_FULL_61_9]HCM25971.1 hypothetical protein [Treponema sp.]